MRNRCPRPGRNESPARAPMYGSAALPPLTR
jgi:hypothetical protein